MGQQGVFKTYDISNIPFYELASLLEDVKLELTHAGPVPEDVELSLVLERSVPYPRSIFLSFSIRIL